AYAASKAALNMLTRTLAAEFAGDGVRCNCVVPGMIDTPMVGHSLQLAGLDAAQAAAVQAARHRRSPTGRQGSPWDVAQAALFLAGPEAGYVNGAELVVDGGYGNLAAG
ncbi:MAG: SDR family NAD(P)-dependent oxidoreductase, partial [Solimonas sp.]